MNTDDIATADTLPAPAEKPRRLTRIEAAKVRSLMVDEGLPRREAAAWVRTFGASDDWRYVQ